MYMAHFIHLFIYVLCMPFADRNQFFDAKITFCILLSHKMYKITQKKNILVKEKFFKRQIVYFHQQTVCRAPVCWSKYTTLLALIACGDITTIQRSSIINVPPIHCTFFQKFKPKKLSQIMFIL